MLKILTFAAAASLAVSAQAVVVINGSFENGAAIPGGSLNVAANDTTTVTGWRALNANIDYVSSQVWDAGHGRRSIDLAGTAAGGILQRINGFTPGEQYKVVFSLSANPFGANGNYLATLSVTGGVAQTFTYVKTAANTPTNMLYQRFTYLFTASSAFQNIQFRANNTALARGGFGPVVDRVGISLVPEPATWAMLIAGFGMIGLTMRRRAGKAVAA